MAGEKWHIFAGSRKMTIDKVDVSGVTAAILNALGLGAASPGTVVASSPLVVDANKGIGGFRQTAAVMPTTQAAAGTLNATGTLTAALLLGGIVTSTTGAAVVATLDTATILDAAYLALFPGGQPSDYIEVAIVNTGGNTFTVATAAGWTDGGNAFVAFAAATSGKLGLRRTAANTWTIFKVA